MAAAKADAAVKGSASVCVRFVVVPDVSQLSSSIHSPSTRTNAGVGGELLTGAAAEAVDRCCLPPKIIACMVSRPG